SHLTPPASWWTTSERVERARSQAAITWLKRAKGGGHRAHGSSADQVRPRAQLLHARFLSRARRLPGAEARAREEARRDHRAGQSVRPARPWRRGVSD